MKTILRYTKELKPELVIYAENDVESMALQMWSEKYFRKDNENDEQAYLVIEVSMIDYKNDYDKHIR